jgi:hypothetical protein
MVGMGGNTMRNHMIPRAECGDASHYIHGAECVERGRCQCGPCPECGDETRDELTLCQCADPSCGCLAMMGGECGEPATTFAHPGEIPTNSPRFADPEFDGHLPSGWYCAHCASLK